jgi:predicted nucleotidyltransferase
MSEAALAETLREILQSAAPDVVAVYLYGSRARGNARRESDVDMGALLATAPRPTLRSTARKLEADLEAALGIPVEVVALNTAPADLVHRVLRDGVLLLDRDRAARLRFEVQSRNEYFDLAPLRRLYRRIPA